MSPTAYEQELYDFIQPLENAAKLTDVYTCTAHIPTLGSGYAFIEVNSEGDWVVKSTLLADLQNVGIPITQEQKDKLDLAASRVG